MKHIRAITRTVRLRHKHALLRRKQNLTYVHTLKNNQPCFCCGQIDYRHQYHHRNPDSKVASICDLYWAPRYILDQEIAKCILVCNTCHITLHDAIDHRDLHAYLTQLHHTRLTKRRKVPPGPSRRNRRRSRTTPR